MMRTLVLPSSSSDYVDMQTVSGNQVVPLEKGCDLMADQSLENFYINVNLEIGL